MLIKNVSGWIWWKYSLERNARNCSGCGSSSDDLQNLFQSRQAAAHLEGHLVCIVLLRQGQRGRQSETEVQSGDGEPQAGQGITWPSPEREPLFLLQGRGIENWNKVIPKVFLVNLKSAQPDSAPPQSSFSGRQMLCRLQLAPGWSQWMTRLRWNWENATRLNKEQAN